MPVSPLLSVTSVTNHWKHKEVIRGEQKAKKGQKAPLAAPVGTIPSDSPEVIFGHCTKKCAKGRSFSRPHLAILGNILPLVGRFELGIAPWLKDILATNLRH